MSTERGWRRQILGAACLGLLWGGALSAQAAAAPAGELHGRIERHDGLVVLRLWGDPGQRGYAHGRLLHREFAAVALPEFEQRFARRAPLLAQARAAVKRLIEYPDEYLRELEGLWQGLADSGIELRLPQLDRSFDFTDLLVANALDVFGLMGCSGFTVWGEQADGGGVLTARNFDWPLTGRHLLEQTILIVSHLPGGRAVAAVSWPGYIGAVTGVSSDGIAAFLHVGSAAITYTPQPSSWPSAVAVRELLAHGASEPAAAWARAKDLLGNTSPPAGFLTHVVLPVVPVDGAPAVVFETDAKSCVAGVAGPGPVVVTNHFRTRSDGRPASGDSVDRQARLEKELATCFDLEDRRVSIEEAWQILASVDRGGGHAFGTLHSLVFRHEPWCFELRIGTVGGNGIVAAPVSDRRYALSRRQVFADGETPGR
jgi:hypothetical protein